MASVWSLESFSALSMLPQWLFIQQQAWKRKDTSSRIKLQCWRHTVNSRYYGHHRDQHLMSIIERVHNSGSCFQQFLSFGTSALICNNGVSVIASCPQGGSWLRYALLKNAMVTFHFCFGFNSTIFMHKNYLFRLKWMISTNSHPESMVPWSTKGHQARLCDNLKICFFFLKSGCLH